MTIETADKLAAELGDLPLAAAQAAGYLEQTGLPSPDYLRRFRTHRAGLLADGDVLDYQGRVDTTWAISLERLQRRQPGRRRAARDQRVPGPRTHPPVAVHRAPRTAGRTPAHHRRRTPTRSPTRSAPSSASPSPAATGTATNCTACVQTVIRNRISPPTRP